MRNILFFGLLALTSCSSIPRDLQKALVAYPDLKVVEVGDTIVIQGEVTTPELGHAVNALLFDLSAANQNGKTFINRVELSPQARSRQAAMIQNKIAVPTISAHFVGESLFLEGVSPNDYEADRAVEIAKSFLQLSPSTFGDRRPSEIFSPRIVDMLRVNPLRK